MAIWVLIDMKGSDSVVPHAFNDNEKALVDAVIQKMSVLGNLYYRWQELGDIREAEEKSE